jgi:hypothetical protein
MTMDETTQPMHCGQPAVSVGSGCWECPRCDAYAIRADNDTFEIDMHAPLIWKK